MIERHWRVNGVRRAIACAPLLSLLDALRDHLGITGPKEGCGEGECGACLVLLDGLPVTACLVAAGSVPDGARIWTAEGLSELPLGQTIVNAFALRGAVQCGICFPGMLVSTFAFLRDEAQPTEDSVREALSGNLCRCTGYSKIVEAVLAAADERDGMPLAEPEREERSRIREEESGPPEDASSPSAMSGGHADEKDVSFHAPRALEEALSLRARHPEAALLAGGTDLMVAWQARRKAPVLAGDSQAPRPPIPQPAAAGVIALGDIPELRGIARDGRTLRIGATTSVEELAGHPDIALYAPALRQAARELGARPIRHLATLGGNLVNASPAADLAPPLLAANASLEIASAARRRRLPLASFYRGYKSLALEADEIVIAILLPALHDDEREGYRKLGTRRAQSIAKVCAAARVKKEGDHLAEIAIAAGSVAAVSLRLYETERLLRGERWSPDLRARAYEAVKDEVRPIDDLRSTREYRREMAAVVVTDLLDELCAPAREP